MGRPRTVSDDRILQGASQVIARVGPARLTLAEVGKEVGLSAAALTQRFKTKRGLLLAVARQGVDMLPERLAEAQSADAPVQALVDSFAALAGSVRTSAEFANHLAFLLMDLADPEFHAISREYARVVERAIGAILDASLAAGEISAAYRPDLPRAIHAAYNGAMVTWGMHGEGSPAEQVRTLLGILLDPYLTRGKVRADGS